MPAHRYMKENGSAAMLATKTFAGVAPEVNLGEHLTHTPLPCVNKLPTLALKHRAYVIRSPKYVYQ